jgi:hypothetical protein
MTYGGLPLVMRRVDLPLEKMMVVMVGRNIHLLWERVDLPLEKTEVNSW